MSYLVLILALHGASLNLVPKHANNLPPAARVAMESDERKLALPSQTTCPSQPFDQLPKSTPPQIHVLYHR